MFLHKLGGKNRLAFKYIYQRYEQTVERLLYKRISVSAFLHLCRGLQLAKLLYSNEVLLTEPVYT